MFTLLQENGKIELTAVNSPPTEKSTNRNRGHKKKLSIKCEVDECIPIAKMIKINPVSFIHFYTNALLLNFNYNLLIR